MQTRARVRSSIPVVVDLVRVTREAEVTFLAASVAYYSFVSVIPLLVVGLSVATIVGGEALAAEVATLAGEYLLPAGQAAVEDAVRNQQGQGAVTVLGFLVTLWGGLKFFRGVDTAFSRVYGTEAGDFVDQLFDGVVVLAAVGVGVVVLVGVNAAVVFFRVPLAGVVSSLLLLPTLAVAFFPLYYVFPDTDVSVREVAPGSVFAGAGWAVLGAVFATYASYASSEGSFALYGALGSILLLLTWFYFAGVLLLTGAVLNAYFGGHLRDRQLQLGPPRRADETAMSDDSADATDGRSGGTPGERGRDTFDTESPDRTTDASRTGSVDPEGAPDISELQDRVEELRADLDEFEDDVDARTVKKPELESELKRYVRRRMRRGHARGWGPYLVLLYGTLMTLGAFYFLDGGWAILAMLVLFLSTLGLYVLFVMVGLGLDALGAPGKAVDFVRDWR